MGLKIAMLILCDQGQSGHTHTMVLTEDDLKVLRQQLVVDVKSSIDANHAHMVRITRIPVPNLV